MSQSKLRFSIEESVWLKKGQEVAEVLSMSLNPEINITEEAGQVYIKGALILSGNYCTEKQDGDQGANLDENPFSEGVSYRSLTQLNVTEDGVTELVHRFPVDITIPSYRVEDASQVKVEVESFEYELPNSTCFELSASICIYGIKDEKQRQESQSDEAVKEAVRSAPAEDHSAEEDKSDIFTPFQFEARQSGGVPAQPEPNEFHARFNEEAAEVRTEKKTAFEFKPQYEAADDKTMEATFDSLKSIAFSNENTRNSSDQLDQEPEIEEQNFTDADEEEIHEQSDDIAQSQEQYASYEETYAQQDYHPPQGYNYQPNNYQDQQPYPGQHSPYAYNNPYQQQNAYPEQQNSYSGYHPQNFVERPYNEQYGEQSYNDEPAYEEQGYQQQEEENDQYYEYEQEENSYEEAAAPQEEEREEEPKDENALYLTKMLSGKEERFSKMKMYILQRGDSLEHICERYEISLNTLMRMNQIQQGDISEGQIIYIPVSSR